MAKDKKCRSGCFWNGISLNLLTHIPEQQLHAAVGNEPELSFPKKQKIRTLLLSEKSSDFHCLVRPGGFEPLAFRVGAERSIQLSYDRIH